MRTIERANAFKRDYKRSKATPRYSKDIDALLSAVLENLSIDQPLPPRNRDQELSGNWKGYRECHLRPDFLLIHRKSDADTLRLARLGSHCELFD